MKLTGGNGSQRCQLVPALGLSQFRRRPDTEENRQKVRFHISAAPGRTAARNWQRRPTGGSPAASLGLVGYRLVSERSGALDSLRHPFHSGIGAP